MRDDLLFLIANLFVVFFLKKTSLYFLSLVIYLIIIIIISYSLSLFPGLAVLLNIDSLSSLIHSSGGNASVIGLSDSSFFLNHDSDVVSVGMQSDQSEHFVGYIEQGNMKFAEEIDLKTRKNIYGSKMKSIVKLMNLKAGMPSACLKKNEKSPEKCIFAENLVEHIASPVFILQVILKLSYVNLFMYFNFLSLFFSVP